jgi:hypothetical protein
VYNSENLFEFFYKASAGFGGFHTLLMRDFPAEGQSRNRKSSAGNRLGFSPV